MPWLLDLVGGSAETKGGSLCAKKLKVVKIFDIYHLFFIINLKNYKKCEIY